MTALTTENKDLFKMKIKIIISIYIILFCVSSLKIIAQTRDKEIWTGISLDVPIVKKFGIELEQQLRYENNYSLLKWHITDFSVYYRITKWMKFSTTYRYRNNENKWQNNFYANLYFDKNIKSFKLLYRLRYFKKFIPKKRNEEYIRNKISIKYNKSKMWFKPYVALELFYLINNLKYTDRATKYRFYLGFDIPTFKRQSLTLYWMYQEDMNIKKIDISSIFGIFYDFELKKLF